VASIFAFARLVALLELALESALDALVVALLAQVDGLGQRLLEAGIELEHLVVELGGAVESPSCRR
jgi:hypothetical protein